MNILYGILVLAIIIAIGYGLSESRKDIKWKTTIIGLVGQVFMIWFVLKTSIGQAILTSVANGFNKVIACGMEGITFVFGHLATDGFVFCIGALSMIVFTSSLIAVLSFLKVIPFLVDVVGGLLAKLLGTTKAETMSMVSNSFLSGCEAPQVIRPYLPKLTRSEFFCTVAGGFSSAGVSALAGYSALGIDMRYLLVAVFTVPFASLMISKLLIPETETSETANVKALGMGYENLFEAISDGAVTGGQIAIAVGCSLIAFIGLVALLNIILGFVGLSFTGIISFIFTPIAWIFNIPTSEVNIFATCLGQKTTINEFIAYTTLNSTIHQLTPRTIAILSVILCNFCNFSVIAIETSGIGSLCPSRREEVAKMGLKALLCGLLSTLSTGAIVGMMF